MSEFKEGEPVITAIRSMLIGAFVLSAFPILGFASTGVSTQNAQTVDDEIRKIKNHLRRCTKDDDEALGEWFYSDGGSLIQDLEMQPKFIYFATGVLSRKNLSDCDRMVSGLLATAISRNVEIEPPLRIRVGKAFERALKDPKIGFDAATTLCRLGNPFRAKGIDFLRSVLAKPSEKFGRAEVVEKMIRLDLSELKEPIRRTIQDEGLIEFLETRDNRTPQERAHVTMLGKTLRDFMERKS